VKQQTEDLRGTLLGVSIDLIAREGLEAFSMREVARRAGVSHQAPYHHFADREAILAALVADGFTQLRTSVLASLEKTNDPIDRLLAMGRAYVDFALKQPAYFKLMFRSELVQMDKHPQAQVCAQSAFTLLVEVVNDAALARYGRHEPTLVLVAWSIAHGLSTLLLEGKLKHQYGASKKAQTQAADAALAAFASLVKG
jgi:AcrR family transcriptional regulator